jgi:5-(carboxyamino)imidazole ribonucleotide synthase
MKIGILGGGQLGRMFVQNALKYDDQISCLEPAADAPCAFLGQGFVQGDFRNYDDVLAFGQGKDVVSIEIEDVNVEALFELEEQGIAVIPNPKSIALIQQKILQKQFYKARNIPSPEFQIIHGLADEIHLPLPFVQKLNTGGYDGKGVQLIRTEADMANLWDAPSVIEKLVDINKELSVIVCQNPSGERSYFPVTEMLADPMLNLLDFNVCPADINADTQAQIAQIAEQFIEGIHSPGLFAIELFLDQAGKVWVNEVAPRLHNSGHQSQEGNANGQFEQLYRVLTNKPLADTTCRQFSGMLNLVGAEDFSGPVVYEGLDEVLKMPQTYIHLYGKTETKPGRKMGHINCLAETREDLEAKLMLIKSKVVVKA